MVILENQKIVLPTDTVAMAMILEKYASDWVEVLAFFEDYCDTNNIPLDVAGIEAEMQKIYGE